MYHTAQVNTVDPAKYGHLGPGNNDHNKRRPVLSGVIIINSFAKVATLTGCIYNTVKSRNYEGPLSALFSSLLRDTCNSLFRDS